MRRTTIFLPADVHERLRREAFTERVSMAELIRLKLQEPASKPARKPAQDPLMKVAGICRGAILSENIDDELYGR